MLILQIGSSLACVTGFALLLTSLTATTPGLNRCDFFVGLYLWPLVLYDATCSRYRETSQRLVVLLLWLILGGALWLILRWPLAVFIPAFVIGLPIVWVLGVAVLITMYAAAERPFLPSHS